MAKKIVVFADGTGNAFTTQASNVWRLYEALDQSKPDQIARYIPGVGTAGFKPFALLDGATGIGVPSNVRKLYRFLCWNWEHGDEIHMFGFSRGAFTIRTLIGLIASQGLVPRDIDGAKVPHAEMQRNAMAAWRAYRKGTAPRSWSPIRVVRWIRDATLAIWHRARRHRRYTKVSTLVEQQGRKHIEIHFVGLFDTVEAYGVPIEELRRAIDVILWPISFSNRKLTQKVKTVRHALALDDERTSFHPLRFDMENEATDRIQEMWFAGVHSDIGGGYPDDTLAHVPLVWMSDHAKSAGLRFTQHEVDHYSADASPFGAAHDSRAGLSVIYRYNPRPVAANELGAPPVIHHSVAERMVSGSHGYAPATVPADAVVSVPGEQSWPIAAFGTPQAAALATALSASPGTPTHQALLAVAALQPPTPELVEQARDLIWWRRLVYFALLFAFGAIASLPLTSEYLVEGFEWLGSGLADLTNSRALWDRFWQWAVAADKGLGASLGSIIRAVAGMLPSFATPWLDTVAKFPIACLFVVGLTFALYRANGRLHDRIAERARQAWFPQGKSAPPFGRALRFARCLRTSRLTGGLDAMMTKWVWPVLGGVAIVAVLLLVASRLTLNYLNSAGEFCLRAGQARTAEFDISQPCWASNVQVEKGRRYTIWIEMLNDAPFLDRNVMVDVAGFSDGLLRHKFALPIRRWWSADWFQPIARVGERGVDEWPLRSLDGTKAPELLENAVIPMAREWSKPPQGNDLARAIEAHKQRSKLRRTFVSQFEAPASGELFLYLNDAIIAAPFGLTVDGFYRNNFGRATVTVREVPLPAVGAPVPPTAVPPS